MTLRFLLIAAAAMICLCAADVSHINQQSPQDILVPFNDLLPPPLEESTTEAATTVTKPTKKSYYQQQQARSKDILRQIDEKPKKQPEPKLFLDLLPPFAEAPSNDAVQPQAEEAATTTQQPLTTSSAPTTTTTQSSSVPHVVKPQALHARVAQANSIASIVSPSSSSSSSSSSASSASSTLSSSSSTTSTKLQLSPGLIAQYATYFQFTTPRPPRGPLPTLTPFPRHIKK